LSKNLVELVRRDHGESAPTALEVLKDAAPFNNHDGDEPMTIGTEGACAEPASSTAPTRVG